ncbi:universal stress protein [Streptomyces sp. NPDC056169]|uniref:universal stress protein n=1 Tax=Streptomyces sp. NPDC056169 TaxID=3345734 RepID=UPI0035DD1C2B
MAGTTGPGPQGLGRVAVGVDGSPSAQAAAMWAADEAALRGSGLSVVHATDTDAPARLLVPADIDRSRRTGQEILDRTADAVTTRHPDLPLVKELGRGSPADSLRHAAALSGTIVVGHRGLGGFSSLMLGSVGLRVAATATTPVVVVRGPAESAEPGAVLTGVRDDADLGCARAAAREALLRKVPLRLLHVWNTASHPGTRLLPRNGARGNAQEHVRALTDVADRLRGEFPALTIDIEGDRNTSVPGALVEASGQADLVVVGGRRAPGYLGPTLGRTTLTLLQHAHCPVMLIPRHGPGHGTS